MSLTESAYKTNRKNWLIVADTETLIRHYDKTLEAWLERFLNKKGMR